MLEQHRTHTFSIYISSSLPVRLRFSKWIRASIRAENIPHTDIGFTVQLYVCVPEWHETEWAEINFNITIHRFTITWLGLLVALPNRHCSHGTQNWISRNTFKNHFTSILSITIFLAESYRPRLIFCMFTSSRLDALVQKKVYRIELRVPAFQAECRVVRFCRVRRIFTETHFSL